MTAKTILAFIAGLAIGLALYWFRYQQWQQQLRHLFQEISDHDYENVSLSLRYRLRQAMLRNQSQIEQLQQQLDVWEQILEHAPIGYLQVDAENHLLWCNQQARQLLRLHRWQPGEVRLLLELVRSYELDQLIQQTRNTQQSQVLEWVFCTTDFSQDNSDQNHNYSFSIALKGSSYLLPNQQVGVFLENQQPLVDLSQSSDRLFSELTHELRTPLTSIRLVAEALQSRLSSSTERRWVEQMLNEANRLIRLVEDWLEISQLEKKPQQYLNLESFALRPLIESAWETLTPLAEQKQLHLNYQQDSNVIITADYSRLTQVFLNLFDNAIKYSPAQSDIWVKVETLVSDEQWDQSQNWVQINIIDQGKGLSKKDTRYLFERLYQGDDSAQIPSSAATEFQSSGTGLGLSITRQIVLAHGGTIEAKNHPATGGAWMQITLPNASTGE